MVGNKFSISAVQSQMKSRRQKLFCFKREVLLFCLLLAGMFVPGDHMPSVSAFQIFRFTTRNVSQDGNRPRDKDFPGAAPLKPSRDLVQTLKQADKFAAAGKYDSAIILWQRVLDAPQDEIVSANSKLNKTSSNKYRRYEIVSQHVERTLARLPTEALREYRITVDGNAKSLFAEAVQNRDEKKLGEVVRRFFLSSYGDDAAFYLASFRFDRGDFVGASRLLTKILEDYPDPDVERGKLLFRFALVSAKLGDLSTAHGTLEIITHKYASDIPRESMLAAEREMKRSDLFTGTFSGSAGSWRMELGGPARNHHMASLPEKFTAKEVSELWADRFNIKLVGPKSPSNTTARRQVARVNGRMRVNRPQVFTVNGYSTAKYSPAQMVAQWKKNGWMPSGQLLFDGGYVYYKNENRLVCRVAETGELCWMGRRNLFEMDTTSQFYRTMGSTQSQNGRPMSISEVQLFGDRVAQSMSIANRTVYCLEGPLQEMEASVNYNNRNVILRGIRRVYTPVRERRNWLSAYDSVTGKMKWQPRVQVESQPGSERMGFLAAPVPVGELLLVPVADNGELWLYALKSEDGSTRWKTYLCDEPPGGSSPWIPVGVSVDGADAYVATGTGLVFALDAYSGTVHWAVRYRRSGTPSMLPSTRSRTYNALWKLDGWDTDMAIPHGNRLIVFSSDYDHLLVLDRRDGELLWESPRRPQKKEPAASYCLGILGDGLFVAGKNVVRRYSLSGGRIDWEAELENSFGRGALTAKALYMPVGDSVVLLDPATGKRLSETVLFSMKSTTEPVGNLYSDGKRLLVVGMGRVAALADLNDIMQILKTRIDASDGIAQLTRMRLHARQGNLEAAVSDLKEGYRKVQKKKYQEQSLRILHDALVQLNLSETRPRLVLELIAESGQIRGSDSSKSPQTTTVPMQLLVERIRILQSALSAARKKKTKGTVAAVLRVIPLTDDHYLMQTAQETIAALTGKEDAEIIKNALESENKRVRMAAVFGIPGAFGELAQAQYEKLLIDADDRVRLTVALALANKGSRTVLPVLAALLESEDFSIRAKSAQSLQAFTGQHFHFTSYETPEHRAEAVRAWKTWIEKKGKTAELHFPIDPMSMLLGRTLICDSNKNRVIELDKDGKLIWEQHVVSPYDCQGLPNGHRLVASYTGRSVIEFNAKGEETWRIDKLQLPSHPYSARRLSNGNTLIACFNSKKILEFRPDKSIEWEFTFPQGSQGPRDARRLANGNTLVTLYSRSGRVIEINRKGETVWQFSVQSPYSAQRLENGNTLISLYRAGQIVEVDRDGNTVWSKTGLSRAYDAQRLPNGNTVISSFSGVQEINLKGEVVWERKGAQMKKISRF